MEKNAMNFVHRLIVSNLWLWLGVGALDMLLDTAHSIGPFEIVERADGLCASLVLPYKAYDCEENTVQTDDKFRLGVQRMSKRGYGGVRKGPVLLVHGISVGGDVWVLNPPDQAFAFILADSGYDVWIGNTRSTTFSYGHEYYTKADKGFWDWSVDELAEYDLPAMLNLVYARTGGKIHFVGYSQGSQQLFAALSQGQLINLVHKIAVLAPVAYVSHAMAPLDVASAMFYLDKMYLALHVYEFKTKTRRGKQYVDLLCRADHAQKCFKGWVSFFTGINCCINYTRMPIIDKYETQSTSTKNLAHLAQQYRHKNFAKYDYGFWGNLLHYRQPHPPTYDMSKVPTHNLMLIHGGTDALADVTDVKHLMSEFKGRYQVVFIPDYAHIDFILGMNAKDLAYKKIIDFFEDVQLQT